MNSLNIFNIIKKNLPARCQCGAPNSANHAITCRTGGFPTVRHNAITKNLAVMALDAGYKDVELEPTLLPLNDEKLDPNNRSLYRGNGGNGGPDLRIGSTTLDGKDTLFDVSLLNPYARSYKDKSSKQLFRMAEQKKRNKYNVRVRQVDHANFIPLIAFTNGVLSPSFDKFLQNMAHHKVKNHPELTYNQVITAYRARLSFVIARSTSLCLRGNRISSNNRRRMEAQAKALLASDHYCSFSVATSYYHDPVAHINI